MHMLIATTTAANAGGDLPWSAGGTGLTWDEMQSLLVQATDMQERLTAERDAARGLCVDLEGEAARLRAALMGLCSDASDVLRGWDARKSQRGGMGSNIATEDAGRLTSIYYWERLRTAVVAARAALGEEP
jgi:hypothetical protein